ncbi:MAG: phage tail tape measure protein [Pseudomonadota bacterium]
MAALDVAVILSLVDRLSGPANDARRALDGTGNAAGRLARVGFIAASAATAAVTGALAVSTNQAIAFEAAMADVAKVTDFDVSGVADGLVDFSRTTGQAAEDLAALAASAGQAGMDTEASILQFTDMASTVGVAFDLPAAYVGDALAGMQTALGTTVQETGLLADAINHLSNNTAANAARLLDFGQRAASVGEQYGFAAEQTLAIGGAMIATGAQAEVAATSFRAVGRALSAGSSATDRQSQALQRLGLDAEQVARSMQEDAVGTLRDVIVRLGDVEDHLRSSTISDIFGDEARAIAPLINNLDVLDQSLGLVADSANYAGSAQEEFAARADTAAFRLDAIGANMTAFSREAGNTFLPALNAGLERLLTTLQSTDLQDNWYFRLAAGLSDFAEGALGLEIAADEMTRFHQAGAMAADVMEGLGDRASAFGAGFSEGASENMGELIEAFRGLGEALGLGEGSLMERLFGTEDGWAEFGSEIGAFVTGGLTDLVNIVTRIVQAFNDGRQAVEDFAGWVGNLADMAGSIEIDWAGLVPDVDLFGGIGDGVSGFMDRFRTDDIDAAAASLAALGDAVPETATVLDVATLEQAESAAASIAETMQRAGQIDLAPIVRAALQEAESVLTSESWASHGERLMGTLAAGVRSGGGPLAAAIRSTVDTAVSSALATDYAARRQSALQDGGEL